jgi:hypothetical protein
MAEQSDFDNAIREQERAVLHQEMVARLHQKGLMIPGDAPTDDLADLLSAIDQFETAVEKAGGDLFVDSPTSSQPERPEFVLPHMTDDESIPAYTRRVQSATERLGPLAGW